MPEWTDPQRRALEARGHLLCSAAAGAGKTEVLAERVAGLLADPELDLEPSALLVITFTRAAAAEMRRRITQRLPERARDSARLARQLWLLPQADITTIHGFCERLLRRAFAEAGSDPAYRILEPGEAESLRRQCLEEVLDRRYAAAEPPAAAFAETVRRYGGRRLDAGLRELVLRLHDFARSQEDPAGWLARQAELLRDPGAATALQVAQRTLRRCRRRTEQAMALAAGPGGPAAYLDALRADLAYLDRLAEAAAAGWDDLAAALAVPAGWTQLAARDRDADPVVADRVRALRDRTKDELRALAAGPWGRPLADHLPELAEVARHLEPVLALVGELEAAFAAAKGRLHALDFGDLEHQALAVLRGPGGPALAGRYKEVLVDEAQDLSPLQDALLEALSRSAHLFCVGDPRQSIYGFRLAEPRRLLARARAYAAGGRGERIELPHNFRSRRAVVDAVNFLFDRLFRAPGADLPPEEVGPLIAAAAYPPPDPPVELHLLEGEPDGEELVGPEREAAAVADLVLAWLAEGTVHDGDGPRPARPGDVAVLLRAARGVDAAYLQALRARGLPAWAPAGGGRADTPEGRTVLSWLRVLDNPQQDIPLAATLRGPFGGFSDADLARLRLAAPGGLWRGLRAAALRGEGDLGARARAWLARLERWRTQARQGAYRGLLAAALEETGYLAAVGALPGGPERRRNLEWLLERCRLAERRGLTDVAQVIALLEGEPSGETVAEAAAAAGDAVRVLTVHGAKGLQFPYVVVAGLGRPFRFPEAQGDVVAHREAGVGARAVDPDRHRKWPTLRHAAVAERLEAEARAEELRVLYVALTRARERLALVGSVRGLEERAAEWLATGGTVPDLGDGDCPLAWFGPLLATHPEAARALAALAGQAPTDAGEGPFPLAVVLRPALTHTEAGRSRPEPPAPPATDPPAGDAPPPEVLSRLDAEAAWSYPWPAAQALAAKVTVGELRERWQAAGGQEIPPAALEALPQGAVPPRDRPLRLPLPRFVAGAEPPGPEEVGTATHLVLRHLDPRGPCDRDAVEGCLDDLVRRAILEPRLAKGVDVEALARFLARPLGRRLRAAAAADRLRREVPFAMRLPAAEAYPEAELPEGEWVLVQGVIDALLLEEDGLVVLDYKTDRVAGGAALARAAAGHRDQLALYARAAAAAWGRPVREAWLAFLVPGEDVRVHPAFAGRG